MSSFGDRLDELAHAVGHGKLSITCEVDQVYAKYQHENAQFKHPDGGKAFYLRDPLFEGIDSHMAKLAEGAIDASGSRLKEAAIEVSEDLATGVYEQAPLEFGDLKASAHPKVSDDDGVIYDRPPLVKRQSEEDLRIKGHLRNLFEPGRYR